MCGYCSGSDAKTNNSRSMSNHMFSEDSPQGVPFRAWVDVWYLEAVLLITIACKILRSCFQTCFSSHTSYTANQSACLWTGHIYTIMRACDVSSTEGVAMAPKKKINPLVTSTHVVTVRLGKTRFTWCPSGSKFSVPECSDFQCEHTGQFKIRCWTLRWFVSVDQKY